MAMQSSNSEKKQKIVERMIALKKLKNLRKDMAGDAVVEATILFPIIIMIFAALVLLSIYMPTRGALQRATQYAATVIATEKSDTWIRFDESAMKYYWVGSKDELDNVYVSLFKSFVTENGNQAEEIVANYQNRGVIKPAGKLTVEFGVVNYVVYKEIVVTAKRTIPMPVDLSFVGFPKEIPIEVTSTAVVQNGDEFLRNMDIAVDFVKYIDEKYQISSNEIIMRVQKVGAAIPGFLGI